MQSKAATVAEYLAQLPPDRREALEAIRRVILENLDPEIEERMSYGMIGYCIPHRVYPAGYHCDPKMPLPYAGLASQKGHMSLYLTFMYCGCLDEGGRANARAGNWFTDAWKATGKKLDMGAACIRFKRLEDVPLEVVGEAIQRVSARAFIEQYERNLATSKGGSTARKKSGKATSAKGTGAKKEAGSGKKKAVAKAAPKRTAKKAASKKVAKARTVKKASRKTTRR